MVLDEKRQPPLEIWVYRHNFDSGHQHKIHRYRYWTPEYLQPKSAFKRNIERRSSQVISDARQCNGCRVEEEGALVANTQSR